ncbi:hypothetical protein OEZ85_001995 [Tetradesmus obliquus]|uniref:EndoU domain-containing protein n=1 Tax=Tetradesmus obliquus TaxID=3088 RepID=A0ABY8U1T0_TETOB|nr:hypothetical protein OEZ85_001995 [Tetradesmus obliquus]
MALQPTELELTDLSAAVKKLWELDDNRLEPGKDYDIDVQAGKQMHSVGDTAATRLFAKVSDQVWQRKTFLIFYHLLDNYASATGTAEEVTACERKETADFLEAVMDTRPMRYCHALLVAMNLAPADEEGFKRMLHQMWFELYNRDGSRDSSGFEHVFVGEHDTSDVAVSGFHNWVTFWIEERKGALDYRGFLLGRRRQDSAKVDDADRVLSVQFDWQGQRKPVTTLLVGTSPEFELAMYTLCFVAGAERNTVVLDDYEVVIRCHRIRSKFGDKVGSCFPELVRELDLDQ